MAGDLHRDALRDAGVDHVPHRGSAEVVAVHPWDASGLACGRPRLPEVAPALTEPSLATEERKEGNDPAGLTFDGPDPLELGGQERLELGREVDQAPFVVLRGPGLEPQGSFGLWRIGSRTSFPFS